MISFLQKVSLSAKSINDYQNLTPDILEEIRVLSEKLKGMKVGHVNATSVGGGVAEMLKSVVPLQKDLGLNSSWYVIPPKDDFFEVTKKIHNFLQGKAGDLTDREKTTYLDHNKVIAGLLENIEAEVLVVHDPQPAAALHFMTKNRPKLVIWRCHIDTSAPNENVWNFLYKYLKDFDRFIFTMQDFVHHQISPNKVSLMTPVIDPFTRKNELIAKESALSLIANSGVNITKPLVTQVSRLDPWKDPIGVIDAFAIAKREIPDLQLAFVAQMASDDPEGVRIAQEVQNYAKGKSGIYFFINSDENDFFVNAFQTASTAILQKSIREGFALTVTEAMWKGAVVIGGNVGGIRLQIEDGKNGFLVNSPQDAADRIVYVIKNPARIASISKAARESVKSYFLMPHLLLKEFNLFDRQGATLR